MKCNLSSNPLSSTGTTNVSHLDEEDGPELFPGGGVAQSSMTGQVSSLHRDHCMSHAHQNQAQQEVTHLR